MCIYLGIHIPWWFIHFYQNSWCWFRTRSCSFFGSWCSYCYRLPWYWLVLTYVFTDLFNSVLAIVLLRISNRVLPHFLGCCRTSPNTKWGFVFSSLTVISVTAAYFAGLFPRILVSSLNPLSWSLTITNAGNSTYTLTLLTCVAFVFVPIILALPNLGILDISVIV